METSSNESRQTIKLIRVSLQPQTATTVSARSIAPNFLESNLLEKKEVVILSDGSRTSKDFYERIAQQIARRVPALKRNKKLKSIDLCGKVFWGELSNGDRRMAGRCISHLAATSQIPMVLVKSTREYPKQYQLKSIT